MPANRGTKVSIIDSQSLTISAVPEERGKSPFPPQHSLPGAAARAVTASPTPALFSDAAAGSSEFAPRHTSGKGSIGHCLPGGAHLRCSLSRLVLRAAVAVGFGHGAAVPPDLPDGLGPCRRRSSLFVSLCPLCPENAGAKAVGFSTVTLYDWSSNGFRTGRLPHLICSVDDDGRWEDLGSETCA
jgi:hypothetical protein